MPALYSTDAEKHEWLRRIFDATAGDYDRVEAWLSLGTGRRYRRRALLRAGLIPGMSIADVACGTGLVAREAAVIVGPHGRVVGIDPSEGMLAQARRHAGISALVGLAESLPLASGEFDFVAMGYALRHVEDLRLPFAEFRRVLKPGGRLCILEITRPARRLNRAALRGYMGLLSSVIRAISPRGSRTAELWSYYWRTINDCVPPPSVVGALHAAGFEDVSHRVEFGMFSEYSARRPTESSGESSPFSAFGGHS